MKTDYNVGLLLGHPRRRSPNFDVSCLLRIFHGSDTIRRPSTPVKINVTTSASLTFLFDAGFNLINKIN